MTAPIDLRSEVDAYVDAALPRLTDELAKFVAIPSESARPADLARAAEWIVERMRRLGADVSSISSPDDDAVPPLVVGEFGKSGPALIAVNHYDVQPAEPLELWTSPPYEPQVRDGLLYGRGATDNKGELLARLLGLEAHLAVHGRLPCRVRVLVEGEEERGSPHLGELLDRGKDLRRGQWAIGEGGGVDPEERPSIECGVRGMLGVQLNVRTLRSDIHSALAAIVDNPIVRLSGALSSLAAPDGTILLEGFADGVDTPDRADVARVDAMPLGELEQLQEAYGVDRFRLGRTARESFAAVVFEPTLNIQAIWAGHPGANNKNVVPAEAHARLDLRLVPSQDPDAILALLRRHLASHGFADVEVEPIRISYRPWWTPTWHELVVAAASASAAVLGKEALISPSAPGTAPMWEVCHRYLVPAVSLGASRVDSMVHAPNETYRLADAAVAAKITSRFIGLLGPQAAFT